MLIQEEKMNVAVFRRQHHVEIETLHKPVVQDNEILIKMLSCAICTWDQRAFNGINKVIYPFVGGHEMFATIVELGRNIDSEKWHVGEKVAVGLLSTCGECYYCSLGQHGVCENFNYSKVVGGLPYSGTGGFSEYLSVSENNLFKASEDLNPLYGAFTEPLSCVIHSVGRIDGCQVENVVVLGAGTMGLLHLLVLKKKGVKTIVSEPMESRRNMAKRLGADEVIDPLHEDPVSKVKDLTHGRGADAVFNTTAVLKIAEQALEMIAPLGTLILYSSIYPAKSIEIDPNWVHKKMINITGTANSNQADFKTAVDMLSNHVIDPEPLLSAVIPFKSIQEAFCESMKTNNYRTVLIFE